jgi:hypothetical protein
MKKEPKQEAESIVEFHEEKSVPEAEQLLENIINLLATVNLHPLHHLPAEYQDHITKALAECRDYIQKTKNNSMSDDQVKHIINTNMAHQEEEIKYLRDELHRQQDMLDASLRLVHELTRD